MTVQTEFAFTLPHGYVDAEGNVHRDGRDRADEGSSRPDQPGLPRGHPALAGDLEARGAPAGQSQGDRGAVRGRLRVPAGLLSADQPQRPRPAQRVLSGVRGQVRRGDDDTGGMIGYPSDRLFEEEAYIAYHFHWPHGQIMNLDHRERQRWVEEIAKINKRLNEAAG